MPRIFELRVPVWQADLDAFGEVRIATLLRILQEAATRASSDAGFDDAYYARAGTMWLVRRTTVTVLEPARYGDEIHVATWIADFRRVRSQREYAIRSGDRAIARAVTDWVYVDRVHARPRRVPPEMERVFIPEGTRALERPAFPAAAPPPEALRSERRVELHDLDALRHVNNATYVHYLEQAALDAAAAVGWPLTRQLEAGGRLRAVAHDLEYLDEAVYGEVLEITTWLGTLESDRFERHTAIGRPGTPRPLLGAASTYAWIDVESNAPTALPAALHTALAV